MGEREASGPANGDDDLVAAAKRDPDAFVALYRRYAPTVYGYCYNRLGSREQAEDATSQIFLKALTALPAQRDDLAFRGWLFAIAHNVVTDAHRARRRFWARRRQGSYRSPRSRVTTLIETLDRLADPQISPGGTSVG